MFFGDGELPLARLHPLEGQPLPIGLLISLFSHPEEGPTIPFTEELPARLRWVFDSSQYVDLKDANGNAHLGAANTIISNGERRQFVIYWYQAHGR